MQRGDIPSCNLFEVCNPSIDYILKDATMCCSGNVPNPWIRGKLSACSFARANSNSNNKRCMGLYLIKSLGEEGVYMNNYFSPKWCCSSTTNQGCIDSETEESFFGECKSPGSDIPGVFTENAKKLVCEEPSDFFSAYHWESDTDMSKNSCKNYDWPAHVSLNIIKTGTCTDYSVALTTLLRKAGYMKNEVFTVMSDNHKWNAVKLPGDNKYTFADTTNGHKDNAIILNSLPGNYPYCNSIRKGYYNDNGHIGNKNYINLNQIYGCSQTEIGFIPDTKISKVKPYTLSVVNQSGVYVSKSYSVDASGLIRTNIEVTNKNNRTKIIKITEPIEGDFKINYLIKPNKEKVSYLGEEYGAGPKITDVSWEFNLASNKKQIISYTIQMPAGKNLLISPKTSVSFEGIDLKLNSKTIQIT
ncbi:hypothetical protein J4474_05210 [Candidatus Pacearchaeota archaeon]|nr:hypothetical protein [Candidatus Pacearchaeota archaeon]